jgi:hypothetical protein
MMIVDAIRSACTPHAVYFLVTAYIESLRHFERSCAAPEHVLDLPIAGADDLGQRVRVLERNTVPPESAVAASELATVLACALERVEAFDPPAAAAAAAAHRGTTPHEKNDNRRSARSV